MGTKIPEMRSARRCTWALPFWASSTRRAICASWVSEPTRVARTTRRPPALTVAPTTVSPGPTSTGTDSPVSMLRSTAELPSVDHAVGGDAPRPGGRRSGRPTASCSIGMRVSVPSRQHRDLLGAELQEGAQGRAGLALGPRLEPAAGQDEGGHPGGGLEVDVGGAVAARRRSARTGGSCPASRPCRGRGRRATSRRRRGRPTETRVSMVVAPWRRLVHAARWNGHAPHTTTGAARVSESHCQ